MPGLEDMPSYEELFPCELEIEKRILKEKSESDEDIVLRLRESAKELQAAFGEDDGVLLLKEAADEIEILRSKIELLSE